jgi:hypothetical protein
MKPVWILLFIMLLKGTPAMGIEEAPYIVVKVSGIFEIRDYEPHILAETLVDGTLEDAGNKAFRRLFTMTAPVSQHASAEKWAVSFMMPARYTLATLPVPDDNSITVRQVPARRMAAVRYSGTWSEKNYLDYKERLENWIRENGFESSGEPVWARYNPPFTLWFLRRNEILIPVVPRPAS